MFGGFRLELQYESVMYQFHQDDVQCIHEVRKLLLNWQSVDSSESLMQKLQIESYSLGEPSKVLSQKKNRRFGDMRAARTIGTQNIPI